MPSLLWDKVDTDSTTCAITVTGKLYCWGDNAQGTMGDGTKIAKNVPTAVIDPSAGMKWSSISVSQHACGLEQGGTTAYCWGANANGETGLAAGAAIVQPTSINGTWTKIVTSSLSTYGTDGGYKLLAFGYNAYGELGDNTNVSRSTSALVMTPNGMFERFAGGLYYACAIMKVTPSPNRLFCWGVNQFGQFGNQTVAGSYVPVEIPGDWVAVDTGRFHTCAIKRDGGLYCFGINEYGQLGDGTLIDRHSPTRVGTDTDWSGVYLGYDHSCATKFDNSVWCWGSNEHGQQGDGTAFTFAHTVVK